MADVRHFEELVALREAALAAFGKVHVLCNNAGVGGRGLVAAPYDLEAWRWTIDVNLWGVIHGCKAFLPHMIAHGEPCHVVNTASMAGLGSMPTNGAYNVSKHGVVALSETLSMEMQLAGNPVGVSVVCPAFVATRIGESRRNMPDDVRAAVAAAPPSGGPASGASKKQISDGMRPEVVAQAVLDAVLGDDFWIITHEETKPSIVQHARDVVDGVNPGAPSSGRPLLELDGKTAVITGAASGIGLELAHRLGLAGMKIVAADVEAIELDQATRELSDAGYDVLPFVVDVRNHDEVVALEAAARARFGNVHLLCNNAGVGADGPVADPTNLDAWRWTIDVDLWGVIHGCKVFLPHMIEHGEPCHVVNTSSMAGFSTAPTMAAYSMAKYGVVALSETLALEMRAAGTNVGVSVLCPALVATRIAESDRNMPDDLRARPVVDEAELRMREKMMQAVAAGMSTDVVADAVLDAVLADRFWIITHTDKLPGILRRAHDIVDGVNPKPKTRTA